MVKSVRTNIMFSIGSVFLNLYKYLSNSKPRAKKYI